MEEFLSQKHRVTGDFVRGMIDEIIEGVKQNLVRHTCENFRMLQVKLGLDVLVASSL